MIDRESFALEIKSHGEEAMRLFDVAIAAAAAAAREEGRREAAIGAGIEPRGCPTPGACSCIPAQWRPIETAPRDGTVIDLWRVFHPSGTDERFCNCHWCEGEWRMRGGIAIEWDWDNESCVVTHWMPQPEPPK
jgi:hypothetical protein